jgi:peptidoglycan/LPS O-acetylase OafA/YrhL
MKIDQEYVYPFNVTIQGVRGLAILMIFFLHAFSSALRYQWITIIPGIGFKHYLLMCGNAGVDIFFIIAGYLAVNSMINEISFAKYILKRIIRIYPVFLILLVFTYCIGPLFPHNFLSNISVRGFLSSFIFNVLLLPGILDRPPAIPVSWALSYIFLFYILWGISYRAYKNIHDSIFHVLALAVSSAGFIFFIYFHPRSIFFFIGIFVYYSEPYLKNHIRERSYYAFISIISLLLMISFLSLSEYKESKVYLIFIASTFGYLFFLLTIMNNKLIFINNSWGSRVMTFMGNISYSFYLIHGFGLYLIVKIFNKFDLMHFIHIGSLFLFIAISLIVSIFLSWVSYKFIEVRFTNEFLKKCFL